MQLDNIPAMVKQDAKDQMHYWRTVFWKDRTKCTLQELDSRIELVRVYVGFFTITTLSLLTWVMYLALAMDVSISYFNVLLFVNVVCLYDEQRNYSELKMLKYIKTQEIVYERRK